MTQLSALERVYIGAAFLVKVFPDVTHVSDVVLDSFRLLHPDTSLRDQERFVRKFREVHKNTVWARNVPDSLIEESWNEARKRIVSRTKSKSREAAYFRSSFNTFRMRLDEWRNKSEEKQVRIVVYQPEAESM